MSNKTYVLDTSVCLTESSCLYRFEDNDIIIPLKVLEEIDAESNRNCECEAPQQVREMMSLASAMER